MVLPTPGSVPQLDGERMSAAIRDQRLPAREAHAHAAEDADDDLLPEHPPLQLLVLCEFQLIYPSI